MAEVAALVVVKKISSALLGIGTGVGQSQLNSYITKEVDLFSQLPSSMSRIQREFSVMHTFLRNVESQSEEALETWLYEVRKIAHEVEDIVDNAVHLLGDKRLRGSFTFFKKVTGKIFGQPTIIFELHYVASRLKVLEGDLLHIIQVKDRWVQKAIGSGNSIRSMNRRNSQAELFGINENLDKLKKLLESESTHEGIISIWGAVGVGKSTLVDKLYDFVKEEKSEQFAHHALVTVPLGCSSDELLRLIVKEAYKKVDDKMSTSELFQSVIDEKSYLIILDGVHEIEDFNHVWGSFPHNSPDSRMIFTTQFKRVADLAQENCRIEIKPMEEKSAKELFCIRALSRSSPKLPKSVSGPDILTKIEPEDLKSLNNQRTLSLPTGLPNGVISQFDLLTSSSAQDGHPCTHPYLRKPAIKIFQMCGFSPLAIVTVANALSRLEPKAEAWEGFINDFQWHLENNKSLSPLKLAVTSSLQILPKYLKSCLLFCCMFPIDFRFTRKRLIRLWVAEGFIERRGHSLLEEVAEQCLNELVERCMFEVIERNSSGRIKKFKMHAVVQIIVSAKSKRESFSMLCDKLEDLKHYSEARHLCLDKCNVHKGSTIDVPDLRSFMASRSHISSDFLSSLVSSCKYLTVLHLENSGIECIPDDIGDLFNLRYLNLRSTKVHKLPKTVRKLENLQTLDIVFTGITELPNEVAMLKKLRHFFAGKVDKESTLKFDFMSGVGAPKGIKALTELQTLFGMDASDKLLSYLQKLSHLRSLTITKVKNVHCALLCDAMKKLRLLSALRVVALDENEQLNFENLDEALSGLQKFEIQGSLSKKACKSLVTCLAKNPNFTCLYLGWTGLKTDPLPILGQLKNLRNLILNNAFAGDQLHFMAHAFPKLKSLILANMGELDVIKFDEHSAEKLESLILRELPNLDDVEGIGHLKFLQKLSLHNVQQKAVSALEGKVSNVKPSVTNDPKRAENSQALKGTKKTFSFENQQRRSK